jgi:hypothetical protein
MASNIEVKLDVLNQLASPALYAAALANRPAASFTGRLFVDSDAPSTGIYRDTGTTWVQVADQGAGTTGTLQQVTTNGSSTTIGISTSGNGIGIGTTIPASNRLDIHSGTGLQATFNGTGVTNAGIQLQLAGVGKWTLQNNYNAAANDFVITDVLNTLPRLTIKNTGQSFFGTVVTSSGLLVVNSATSDNHFVAIGANAPSLRFRDAGTGGVLNCGVGISTAVNNFIQGSASGNYCIFNSSTTASPILFGVYDAGTSNTQEAARISAARNFLVGTVTDGGFKLSVVGTSYTSGNVLIGSTNTGADGIALTQNLNYSFSEGSTESYVNLFRQRNSAGGVLAQGYKRSLTGEFASSISTSYAKAAIVVGEINGSISFYSDAATTVANGTDITPTAKMTLSNNGTFLINSFDTTGNRTNAFNVLTLVANNSAAPYEKFGGAILFKNSSYVTGVVNSARIRSFISDGGGGEGGGFIFETTPTAGGTLTPSLTVKYTGVVNITSTSIYATNALALAGGLVAGDIYKSATGVLSIVY